MSDSNAKRRAGRSTQQGSASARVQRGHEGSRDLPRPRPLPGRNGVRLSGRRPLSESGREWAIARPASDACTSRTKRADSEAIESFRVRRFEPDESANDIERGDHADDTPGFVDDDQVVNVFAGQGSRRCVDRLARADRLRG